MRKVSGKRPRKGPRGEVLPEENEGLPDTNRPSGLCPRCGKQSSFNILGNLPVTYDYETYTLSDGQKSHEASDRVSSLICRHCGQGVVVIEEQRIGDSPRRKKQSGGLISYRGIHWWPLPDFSLSDDVPASISSSYSEAARCHSSSCFRAASVMARRTLESIAVEKGYSEGKLYDRITEMDPKN